MRLVLLGRTAAPAAETADTQAFADAAQLKSGLLKQALARGEKPKPVEIERSEEHTSELQSLMRISYAVFCLKKKTEQLKTLQTQSDNKCITKHTKQIKGI